MRQHKGDTIALITSISGPSGSGKTHSFKNLNWDETFVFRPNRKPFSFPKSHLVAKPWNSKRKTGNFTYIEDYSSIFSRMQKLV
ncbi:MAG: hypothetical protein U9N61_09845, partial [Euryarchaeota archaeon]|nr:hypothetical protein [Euryarchaeota archaeon]